MAQDKKVTANRTYKSSVFTMVFQEKKELLELYNAVSGKHYEDPEKLEINTLDNAIYMSIKNDLSFIIDSRLSLYEHQSTYNPNLPLRCLFYVADNYSKIALHKDICGSTPLSIPDPQFVIFYNGEQEVPEREIMRLSSLYTVKEERPKLELEAVMLNIRPGHNQKTHGSQQNFAGVCRVRGAGEKVCKDHGFRGGCREGSDRMYRRRNPQRLSGEKQSGGDQSVSV